MRIYTVNVTMNGRPSFDLLSLCAPSSLLENGTIDLQIKMAESQTPQYDMSLTSHSFIFVYNESEFPLDYMFHIILNITPTREHTSSLPDEL